MMRNKNCVENFNLLYLKIRTRQNYKATVDIKLSIFLCSPKKPGKERQNTDYKALEQIIFWHQ